MPWQAPWIWTPAPHPDRNAFVRFRRVIDYSGGPAAIELTADSRYMLYVNGEWVGHGPVRGWPAHWHFDRYDLTPHLVPGDNVVGVVVQRFGDGTFQCLTAPSGLSARLELRDCAVTTDESWQCALDPAPRSATPRVSCQLGWEEQYDARLEEPWLVGGFDDSGWDQAVLAPEAEAFHPEVTPRGIPMLTHEPRLPQRIVSVETVQSQPQRYTLHCKSTLHPADRSANMTCAHAYLAARAWSPVAAQVRCVAPHKHPGRLRVNGVDAHDGLATLRAGDNDLLFALPFMIHIAEFVAVFEDAPDGFRVGDWAVAGPFELTPEQEQLVYLDKDDSLVVGAPVCAEATVAAADALWSAGSAPGAPWWQPLPAGEVHREDVFVQAFTDRVVGTRPPTGLDGLLSAGEWVTLTPPADGDLRLLLDYGEEVVGYQRFEIDAPAGTVVDAHNFEFIQPDGRYNFADGMNNSFRYICREGRQRYQTWQRRGFRYAYLMLRDLTGPVRLRAVEAVFASYPQSRRGMFACADAQLDRIWQVGAHSLRCCAEDTYTDCPTYEQTHWVGDARNEALVDWTVNGDPRLWYRCLEQTGQSLERSPITESEVPSGWQNLLPAWSCLWMRSCREYYLHSGDEAGARVLLDFIGRNIDGLAAHTNSDGLFEIRAWNMFDWAAMDCPTRGVVTHQNAMAVQALNEAAELARWLGQLERSVRWMSLAAVIERAINRHLWVDGEGAYTDCLRVEETFDRVYGTQRKLVPSPVFSQQTQTAALMAGVATGERAERCAAILHHPPAHFVQAGSPFFEFFLLEALQREGRDDAFLERIRADWGFMVDMGATTFWEMWSGRDGRLTRSHCHGWSAAPTYFLSSWVLGVRPGGPGFNPCIIEPHPGGLAWCRGTVPTPLGDVSVQWEQRPGEPLVLRVDAPEGLELDIRTR